jgi:hypothetical protein
MGPDTVRIDIFALILIHKKRMHLQTMPTHPQVSTHTTLEEPDEGPALWYGDLFEKHCKTSLCNGWQVTKIMT